MNKLEELWGKQGQVFSEIDFVPLNHLLVVKF